MVPGIEGSFPSPGNFGGFLSLKSPLTFLLLQKSQSGLTNALLWSLGAAEPSCATDPESSEPFGHLRLGSIPV